MTMPLDLGRIGTTVSNQVCNQVNDQTVCLKTPAGAFAKTSRAKSDLPRTVWGAEPGDGGHESLSPGLLIVNADDWGRSLETTQKIFDCIRMGAVSSVSAMVFMEDSFRAATLAREQRIDAGLHLNLTTPFSAPECPARLAERQRELAAYLRGNPLVRAIFHPGLVRSFEYVVTAQLDEFCRLYRSEPERIDGHHHMHLCANVLLQRLLPAGTIVRRHFSFEPGEKRLRNSVFRQFSRLLLVRRHSTTDYFFSLPPLEPPARLQRIFSLARRFVVEVETHPVNPREYRFLADGEIFRWTGDIPVAPRFSEPRRERNEP